MVSKCTFSDRDPEAFIHLFCTCIKIAFFRGRNESRWIESKL